MGIAFPDNLPISQILANAFEGLPRVYVSRVNYALATNSSRQSSRSAIIGTASITLSTTASAEAIFWQAIEASALRVRITFLDTRSKGRPGNVPLAGTNAFLSQIGLAPSPIASYALRSELRLSANSAR